MDDIVHYISTTIRSYVMYQFIENPNQQIIIGDLKIDPINVDSKEAYNKVDEIAITLAEKVAVIIKNKFGTPTKSLGTGYFGRAYLLSNSNVIKITKDESEIHNAHIMTKHKFKNVNNIMGFKRIDKLPVYIIYMEYGGEPFKIPPEISDDQHKSIINNIIKTVYDNEAHKIPDIYPYNQILNGLNELSKAEIRFTDLHNLNILEKDGVIKLIDIGANDSDGNLNNHAVLESKLINILNLPSDPILDIHSQ